MTASQCEIVPLGGTAVAGPLGGREASRQPGVPLWALWLIAVAIAAVLTMIARGTGSAFEFLDSDDALRFIQVRELMAGASWFEIKTHVLGGADGLVSHWSRLIDGPMAVMLWLFQLLLSPAAAQNLLVTVWPIAMFGAVLWAIARCTLAAYGRQAAQLALALGALAFLAYYQFVPGRLDHHNVMIATSVSAALIVWAWPQSPAMWRWAGALCGLALAIGYEALAPVFAISALAAGWGLIDRRQAAQAAAFTVGLVAALMLALVLTVAPTRWMEIHCDALSLNLVALAAMAGGGFIAVMRYGEDWSWPHKIAVLAVTSGAGLAAFGWMEPACLAGPMDQVPPALGPIWINHVDEAQSLLVSLARGSERASVATLFIHAIGLGVASVGLARSRRSADRFLLFVGIAFVALALWQMKFTAYAALIVIPGMVVAISAVPQLGEIRAPVAGLLVAVLLSQPTLMSFASGLKTAVASIRGSTGEAESASSKALADQQTCMSAGNLRSLSALPPGLVVALLDIGTPLAAATPHRALAGPYHRIPDAIIANYAILSARDAATAGQQLAKVGADYVLTCRPYDAAMLKMPQWQGTLIADLAAGHEPAFLVPVPLGDTSIYRMWRVEKSLLPAN